jgi:NDP-sugar pyrophosphorylase family protein
MLPLKGMIFAAGLGTRLYPLTADRPKALVEINGVTLLEHAINKLVDAGIADIVINIHHFSDLVRQFIDNHKPFNANIYFSDESEKLLDTGGGLKFASPFFQNTNSILLYNVDIISNINLQKMCDFHLQQAPLATLAVRNRETFRYFIFDKNSKQLCGWTNIKTGEKIETNPTQSPINLAFSGIHIVSPKILELIPENEKISLTKIYLTLASQNKIVAYDHSDDSWQDMGKYEEVIAYNATKKTH